MRSRLPDVLCVVALVGFGFVIRRNVLPRDGLLFDDAWVVLGAGKMLSDFNLLRKVSID